jgi:hypothetical protein
MVKFGKDRKHASISITATYATVTGPAMKFENVNHAVYKDNLFSSTYSLDQLDTKTINSHDNDTTNKKRMLTKHFGQRMAETGCHVNYSEG